LTWDELERLAQKAGILAALAAEFQSWVEGAESWRIEIARRLARFQEALGQAPEAAATWEKVVEKAPEDGLARESLARLYEAQGRFDALYRVRREQAAREPELDARMRLLHEAAQLAEDQLRDTTLTAECCREILAHRPGDGLALERMARVLVGQGNFEEAVEVLERGIRVAEKHGARSRALELRVELAGLQRRGRQDLAAVLTLLGEVLREEPSHPSAVRLLEDALEEPGPYRAAVAELLEPVYRAANHTAGLVQVLEARTEGAREKALRVAFLLEISELQAGPLAQPVAALDAAVRSLRELPSDGRALEQCLRLGAAANALTQMATLFAELAAGLDDPSPRLVLLRAEAGLLEQLDRAAEAARVWGQVVALRPGDTQAIESLERLHLTLEQWPQLLQVLEQKRALLGSPDAEAALLKRMGRLQDERLGDPKGALESFRRALSLRPDDPGTLEGMDDLLERTEQWAPLADVLERRRAAAPEQALEFTLRLGLLHDLRLDHPALALECYAEALRQEPTTERALERLNVRLGLTPQDERAWEILLGAHRRAGNDAALAAALEQRTQVAPTSRERRQLWEELSQVRERTQDALGAFRAQGMALQEEPEAGPLRTRLLELGHAAQAFPELVQRLEATVPGLGSGEAAEVALTLGQLQEERLQNVDEAAVWYTRAQAEPRVRPRALAALVHLWERLERWPELTHALEELAGLETDAGTRRGRLLYASALANDRLSDPDRAATSLRRLLGQEPDAQDAMERLEGLYARMGRAEELAALLERHAVLQKGAAREPLLLARAQLLSGPLGRQEEALALARRSLEDNPRSEALFQFLSELLAQLNRPQELAELLSARLERVLDPNEAARLHERLGILERDALQHPTEAVRHFQAVLERAPRSLTALEALRGLFLQLDRKQDLAHVLERLAPLQEDRQVGMALQLDRAEVLTALEQRGRALEVGRTLLGQGPLKLEQLERLRGVFERVHAVPEVVQVMEQRAALEEARGDVAAAVETLVEIAVRWKEGGMASKGVEALEKVLTLQPTHLGAFQTAEALYTSGGQWSAYAALLEKRQNFLPPGDEKVALLRLLAQIQKERLGEPVHAFWASCAAVRARPEDEELRAEALGFALVTGLQPELAALYQELAAALPWGPLARGLYLAEAHLQDEVLDVPNAAEATLRTILDFEPTDLEALERLTAMFSRRGKVAEQLRVLEETVDVAPTLEVRKRVLGELARVRDELQRDPAGATSALQRSFELAPDRTTAEILLELLRRQGRWREAVETLTSLSNMSETDADRARFHEEAAELYEVKLLNDEAAIAGYRQSQRIFPAGKTALLALERVFTRLDRPTELRESLEQQLAASSEAAGAVSLLHKLAKLLETRFHDLRGADGYLERALSLDAKNPTTLEELKRVRRAQGRWAQLIAVLEQEVDGTADPATKAELWVQKGEIQLGQLRDPDAASYAFNQALQVDGKSRRALHALADLHVSRQDWRGAMAFLLREAEATPDAAEAADTLYRIGQIELDVLRSRNDARQSYTRALQRDPRHLPSLHALRALHEAAEDWSAYEQTLRDEAERASEGAARAAPLLVLAQHWLTRRKDPAQAIDCYTRALAAAPHSLEAALPLADLLLASEDWARAEGVLQRVTAQLDHPTSRRDRALDGELSVQLCRLGMAAERAGHAERSLQAYERAAQVDSTSLVALEGKARLLVSGGRLEDGLQAYRGLLLLHGYGPGALEVHLRMGELHQQLGQPGSAREQFERVLAMNPAQPQALRSLVQLTEEAGEAEAGVALRQRLIRALEGEARFEACVALVERLRQCGDLTRAMAALGDALEIRPEALAVLETQYEVCREARSWRKATEALERMVVLPELRAQPARCRRFCLTLGQLAAAELLDVNRAIAAFRSAVEVDPASVDAHAALEGILSAHRRWGELEESYAWMIQQMGEAPATYPLRLGLWRKLGELRHTVLAKPAAAREALEHAAEGFPDDAGVQELYADLAVRFPGHEASAIEAYRRALLRTERLPHVCGALARLFLQQRARDTAYLGLQAMQTWVGPLSPAGKERLAQLTRAAAGSRQASRALTSSLWQRHLLHPRVRGPLGQIFTLLFRFAGRQYLHAHSDYDLHPRRHRVEENGDVADQVQALRYTSRLLSVDGVELLSAFWAANPQRSGRGSNTFLPDARVGLEPCLTEPLSLKAGGRFWKLDPDAFRARLGYAVAALRPELVLARTLSRERLELILHATVRLTTGQDPEEGDLRAVRREQRLLEKALSASTVAALREQVEAHQSTPGEHLHGYLEGVELTCLRAALLVTGETAPVKRLVRLNPALVPQGTKVRELVHFAFSEDLLALRVATEMALDASAL
jgi:tetratricopeptide (TPR) repeat protein